MRLVLQCRDEREAGMCEHIVFAYARDAGMRGLRALHVAGCAVALGHHVLARGGGTLELCVTDAPKPTLRLRVRHPGHDDDVLPPNLLSDVRREHDQDGTVLVAGWLID